MDYKFIQTSNGPVVLGDDEVLHFTDFAQLFDYMDADPEFADKAIEFCTNSVKEYCQLLIDSFSKPVVGVDLPKQIAMSYQGFMQANEFKNRYAATLAQAQGR